MASAAVTADDDDRPALGAAAAAALAEFLADQKAAEDSHAPDYGLSQFWYTDETAEAVAAAVVRAVGPTGRVACVSCPSLFKALLRLEGSGSGDGSNATPSSRHALLEFDTRFASLGPFALYDYRDPEAIPETFVGAFDAVVADPPYLSAECLERTAVTVVALGRRKGDDSSPCVRVLLSGAVVRATAWSALGLKPVSFRPEHSCKLGNEFLCYTDCEGVAADLGGWDGELGPEEEEEGGAEVEAGRR
jgi:EEF1A lysine methyltransferase 1